MAERNRTTFMTEPRRGVKEKSLAEEGWRCYKQPWKSKDKKGLSRIN